MADSINESSLVERRVALVNAHSAALGCALATAAARGVAEPVVILARPKGDKLARSIARDLGGLRVKGDDVVVAVVERATALRHLGPAVAAEVEAGLRALPAPMILCVAWGGAAVGEASPAPAPADA